jgi:hypothetical protein
LSASDSEGPAIFFTRRTNAGVSVRAEATTDLQDWSLPVTEDITARTDTTETVRVRPTNPTDRAFFRIQVTSNVSP